MSQIHDDQMGGGTGGLDDLRAIASGERGERPLRYPAFNANAAPSHRHVAEKVTVLLDAFGNLLVEWIDALLPVPRSAGLATRSSTQGPGERRVRIESPGTHQPTLELVILAGPVRTLIVRAGDWPDYVTGARVRASTPGWSAEGATDESGEIRFTHLPAIDAGAVQVELILGKN